MMNIKLAYSTFDNETVKNVSVYKDGSTLWPLLQLEFYGEPVTQFQEWPTWTGVTEIGQGHDSNKFEE